MYLPNDNKMESMHIGLQIDSLYQKDIINNKDGIKSKNSYHEKKYG